MHIYLLATFGPLTAFILYYVASTFRQRWYHGRRAKQLGCEPPLVRRHRLPFAIDSVIRLIKAEQEKLIPNEYQRVYDELGQPNTWFENLLGTWHFMTVDPKNIQAVLATQFRDFELGSTRRNNFFPLLGNGIFTSDGKSWEHSRALLRPQFSRHQIADLDLEENHVQHLLKHLTPHADGWTNQANMVPLFFRLTLDSATEFLFGQSIDSQLAALPENQILAKSIVTKGGLDWTSFARCFDGATTALGFRSRLAEAYFLYSPKSFRDNTREVHKFADYYVNLALTTDLSSLKETDVAKSPRKERYIFLQELVKETRDPVELRSQLLNILLAGRDTTAGLLGWTFYLLARHPKVFKKLRHTILEEFGTFSNPNVITFESLKACNYLQHILSEVLRLYAVVPFNEREAIRDTTLPRGGGVDGSSPLYVRKGQHVNYSVHIMHRRKDIWGPDADEFKPERWVGRKPSWEYLPFNGGPRICLGQQFALTEAGYVIVRMLQKFDGIENLDIDPITRRQYTLTTSPAAVPIRLHESV